MKKIVTILTAFLLCASSSFADVYPETIEADKDFYIYNVAAQKYIKNNNGQMVLVATPAEASTWQFSGTSGDVTVKNGDLAIKAEGAAGSSFGMKYPGSSATGTVVLSGKDRWTGWPKMRLSGDKDGYLFSVDKYYLASGNYTYYFAYNGSKFLTNQSNTSPQSKWQLVSKRQIDNTISSIAPSSLTLDAIQGGEAATSVFNINYSGNPTSINITDGTNTLTIPSPAASQHAINVAYQVADNGTQTFTLTDGSNASNKATFPFASASSATLSLTISTRAASGDAIDNDKKPMTITGNVTRLAHQKISWTQNFSALSLTSAAITLDAKVVDENGNPTGRPITYSLSSTGVVKIVSGKLYVLTEGTTSITAKVTKDATYVGAQKTLTINVSGIPAGSKTITSTNAASSGIYTGTIGGPSTTYTFHRGMRQVDLSKCFNSSKQALFDSLYIFGVTTNTDGTLKTYTGTDGKNYTNVPAINTPTTSVACNATTPCYVYAKSGDTYVYTRTFDATKTRYDWETKQNGKHIYFTGYCPFAYMGTTPTEEGWMYFTGGNTNVDIYLDSCQIMGRYKTQTGKNTGYEQYILKLYADIATLGGEKPNNSFMSGLSSPFVFTSTTKNEGQSYKPHIHIAGKNHLKGQLGSYITSTTAYVDIVLSTLEMDAGIRNVYTYSSPISIKPTDLGQYTDLELTDTWKDNTITNGYLKLDAGKGEYLSEKVPVIDMGSPNATLTINGGQYHVRNAAADGNYACNLAVAYRLFSKVVEKEGQKVLLHLYGFGGDMTDNKVIINSGTFTMYKNMYGTLGTGYYKDQVDFLDLRLPAGGGKSQINGGTFNGISNVFLCNKVTSTGGSPINGNNSRWLCLQDVEVSGTNADGTAQISIPAPFDKGYSADPKVCYNLTEANQVAVGKQYGAQSLNAYTKTIDGVSKSVVSLLLPGQACNSGGCLDCEKQEEAVIFQWATAIPKFEASKEISEGQFESVNIGGETAVEVAPSGEQIEYQTNQLMYMDFAGMENYTVELTAQEATLAFDDVNMPRGRFTNTADYTILKHLNILKAVQADTWYTFTAPFDIHSVSVIETKNEKTIAKKTRAAAVEKQAQDNLELMYNIQDFIIPSAEGRASSMMFTSMLDMDEVGGKTIALKHYDGTNLPSANYYLYELKEEVFRSDEVGQNLNITWQPVKRTSGQALMYKGETYAIQFPWCPMCNDLSSRTYYDYWSNKLILFYGQGPQTVYGTVPAAPTMTPGEGTLAGNPTFRENTLPPNAGYIHDTADDVYKFTNGTYTLKPTEGYLVYKTNQASMPARISRSGEIVYPDNTATDLEGVPTIQDHTSIMIYDAMEGFDVLSLQAQMVAVYNLQGEMLMHKYMAEGEQVHVAAPAGLYVVKGEKDAIKIMVD